MVETNLMVWNCAGVGLNIGISSSLYPSKALVSQQVRVRPSPSSPYSPPFGILLLLLFHPNELICIVSSTLSFGENFRFGLFGEEGRAGENPKVVV